MLGYTPSSSNNSFWGSWLAPSPSLHHRVRSGKRKLISYGNSPKLTLSVVVGAATPGAAKWIFAIVCYIGAGVQVLGLIAVSKVSKSSARRHSAVCNKVLSVTPQEKSVLFKRYLSLTWFITIAGFSISVAWIIISATRHSTAQANCENDYYSGPTVNNAASLASEATTVCNIFSWVDVGVMGGLWVVLLLMQVSAEDLRDAVI